MTEMLDADLPRPNDGAPASAAPSAPAHRADPTAAEADAALPGWAGGPQGPEDRGWWSAARRWWQRVAEGPADPGAQAASPAGESLDPSADARPDASASLAANPLPLLERLRRSVAHGLRHPGYGFAVLVLVLRPPADTPARAGLRRQVEHRLQLALRPGDALEMLPDGPDATAAPGEAAASAPLPGAPAAEAPEAMPSAIRVALVLDGLLTDDDLVAVVERVRREMAEPFLSGRTALRLRMALAAVHAVPGAPPQPAESLLARAETLLATLGEEGVAGLDTHSPKRAAAPATARGPCAKELVRALEEGELQLEYQPVVALDTGAVLALDIAWRWQHRQQGRLPAEAVTQALLSAEGSGDTALADRLLREALRTAAADCAPLAREFGAAAPSRLALVLTPAQLARADTADRLAEALAQAGLQPTQLQLILPALPDLADRNPLERLRMLAAQGYALSLEGVGDSRRSPTLASLAAAPLALWRLAPGLLAGPAATGEHRQVLLEGILSYARDRGVATLATGLDTPEPLAQARRRGCPQGQGAALAAPMAAAALPRWLARQIAQPA